LVVKVRLVGALKRLAGKPEIHIATCGSLTVTETIRMLCRKVASAEFERAVVDPDSKAVGPHIIVLVNDRDVSVLQGSRTEIGKSDVLTLVPITHGG